MYTPIWMFDDTPGQPIGDNFRVEILPMSEFVLYRCVRTIKCHVFQLEPVRKVRSVGVDEAFEELERVVRRFVLPNVSDANPNNLRRRWKTSKLFKKFYKSWEETMWVVQHVAFSNVPQIVCTNCAVPYFRFCRRTYVEKTKAKQ